MLNALQILFVHKSCGQKVEISMNEKACPLLSNIEGLRKPTKMISDVHAICADINLLFCILFFRNFSGFYVHRITANAFYRIKTVNNL